jgi:hypothetical protein
MRIQISDPTDLERIGRLIFGERWQRAMRVYLGVSHDTLRRWIFGVAQVPDWVAEGIGRGLTAMLANSHEPPALQSERQALLWLQAHPGYHGLSRIAEGLEASPAAAEVALRTLLGQGFVRVRADGEGLAYASSPPAWACGVEKNNCDIE